MVVPQRCSQNALGAGRIQGVAGDPVAVTAYVRVDGRRGQAEVPAGLLKSESTRCPKQTRSHDAPTVTAIASSSCAAWRHLRVARASRPAGPQRPPSPSGTLRLQNGDQCARIHERWASRRAVRTHGQPLEPATHVRRCACKQVVERIHSTLAALDPASDDRAGRFRHRIGAEHPLVIGGTVADLACTLADMCLDRGAAQPGRTRHAGIVPRATERIEPWRRPGQLARRCGRCTRSSPASAVRSGCDESGTGCRRVVRRGPGADSRGVHRRRRLGASTTRRLEASFGRAGGRDW